MDLAAGFTMGVWVVAAEVATVGVGTAGIEFIGKVWDSGKRLGNYPHLVPFLHWCSGSLLFCHLGH